MLSLRALSVFLITGLLSASVSAGTVASRDFEDTGNYTYTYGTGGYFLVEAGPYEIVTPTTSSVEQNVGQDGSGGFRGSYDFRGVVSDANQRMANGNLTLNTYYGYFETGGGFDFLDTSQITGNASDYTFSAATRFDGIRSDASIYMRYFLAFQKRGMRSYFQIESPSILLTEDYAIHKSNLSTWSGSDGSWDSVVDNIDLIDDIRVSLVLYDLPETMNLSSINSVLSDNWLLTTQVVPEPSSASLLIGGILGLLWVSHTGWRKMRGRHQLSGQSAFAQTDSLRSFATTG